jgi:hypothetical protein
MLSPGDATAAEPKKFTLINVDLDGTKIWLPSSIMVHQGDAVELTLINNNRLRVFRSAHTAHLGRVVGQERWLRVWGRQKNTQHAEAAYWMKCA